MFNRFLTKAKQTLFVSRSPTVNYSMMVLQKKYPHVITEQQRADILAAASASQAYLLNFFNLTNTKPDSLTADLLKKYPNKVDAKELNKSLEHQINNRKFSSY